MVTALYICVLVNKMCIIDVKSQNGYNSAMSRGDDSFVYVCKETTRCG